MRKDSSRHVLVVSNTSWFVFNFFSATLSSLIKDGYKISVLAPKDEYTERLLSRGCYHIHLPMSRSGINPITELKTVVSIVKAIVKTKPDCLFNFTPKINIYCAFIAKLFSVPTINNVAGLGSIFSENSYKSKVGKLLLKATQPLASHIIFQNDDDKNIYLSNRYVSPDKASKISGIGIDLEAFKPVEAPNDGVVRFILVARMLRNKGVYEFVQAAEKVRDYLQLIKNSGGAVANVEFSLLGFVDEDNPQGIPLSQLLAWSEAGVVHYLGHTDNVFDIVKNYDCVVLPSYYREGMPQCLIEAASMAKPIITTDHTGCRDTVDNKVSGYLVSPRSVGELANAMLKIAEKSHGERLAMGRMGRKKAEKEFCFLKVKSHYIMIVDAITNTK